MQAQARMHASEQRTLPSLTRTHAACARTSLPPLPFPVRPNSPTRTAYPGRPTLSCLCTRPTRAPTHAHAQSVIDGADLVIHTAGPFQRCEHHNVLEAALESKTPYLDVSDDVSYSEK
jgi:hypothetical protein